MWAQYSTGWHHMQAFTSRTRYVQQDIISEVQPVGHPNPIKMIGAMKTRDANLTLQKLLAIKDTAYPHSVTMGNKLAVTYQPTKALQKWGESTI